MTISIWRYSHLSLALSSFIFILLASVTGLILAFEPVSQNVKPHGEADLNKVSLAKTLPALKEHYPEILDLHVDHLGFVSIKVIDDDGKTLEFYINPETGRKLADKTEQSAFFKWVTTLHRSLFFHGAGRLFVGITAFLLFLIAISGTILVIKRQKGLRAFFKKIVRENFAQYYHVVLGRLSLIPILIISLTGVYLCMEHFELFSSEKIVHQINPELLKEEPQKSINSFPVFQNTMLSEVQSIEFPFSDDPEDYYTLKLKSRELVVNQLNGDVLSNVPYSTTTLLTRLSLDLHTGRASVVWAMILAVAAVNILFFIYSGFTITIKRRRNRFRNRYSKEECSVIILVGSENGSTFRFANIIHRQLLRDGKKSYLAELNSYSTFKNMEQLIVLTATYGTGDAPTNASRFLQLLETYPQQGPVHFSVLGFGSRSYPDFCRFAFDVHRELSAKGWANPLLPTHTIHDKSTEQFFEWIRLWQQQTGIPLSVPAELPEEKVKDTHAFTVKSKTTVINDPDTFLIQLKARWWLRFTSGDLLAIYPANDARERFYSIAKIGNLIQLSVKRHTNGLGSGYLDRLEKGQTINARLSSNPRFHFPKRVPAVIMISNGTGIAPFLGMIEHNTQNTDCYLYCGFREQASFELYKELISEHLNQKKLCRLDIAYSREGEKQYVKDLLAKDAAFAGEVLQQGGVIMICGSLAMQQNVMELLDLICLERLNNSSRFYQDKGQILMDCY